MEYGHGSGANSDSKAHPSSSTSGEAAERALVSSQSLASTSSSDDFDDTFELNDYGMGISTAEPYSIPTKPEKNAGNGSRLNNDASTTKSPPTQVMERPGESPAAYQIPSSVFNTSKSSHKEWSTASNESLFSIHVGAMSFNKDALLMLGNGEMGLPADNNISSPPMVDYSSPVTATKPHEPTTRRSGNLGGGGLGATEAVSAQTMKEVIRENEEQRRKQQSSQPLQHSDMSSVSVQSFAFDPVPAAKEKHQTQSPADTNSKTNQPKSQPQSTTRASSNKTSAKAEATPQQNPKSTHKKWLPCFSCCSFCP